MLSKSGQKIIIKVSLKWPQVLEKHILLGCLKNEFETTNKLFSVITCPYQHLVQQWKKEVYKFGLKFNEVIIADSSSRLWKDKLMSSSKLNLSMEILKGY